MEAVVYFLIACAEMVDEAAIVQQKKWCIH